MIFKSNHNLVLDVEYRSALEGATVCVFRPHKHGDHENQQWGLKYLAYPFIDLLVLEMT